MTRDTLIAARDHGRRLLGWFQLVHEEGDEHPINQLLTSFWVRLVAVAALAGGLVLLQREGFTELLAWTDRTFPASRYPVLFGGFVALYLAIELADERWRKPILLWASLAAMTYFEPRFAAASVIFFSAYYLVVFAVIPTWLKLGFLIANFAVLAYIANLLWFPSLADQRAWVAALAYAFAVNYTFRIFYFFHEMKMRKFKRVAVTDFALYFVFAPYFVILPYMFAIPRYGQFTRSLEKRNPDCEASGVRYLAVGVFMIVLYWAVSQVYSPRDELMGLLRAEAWAEAFAVGILYYPIEAVLAALGVAYVLTGMLRVLGAEIKPPFQRPLAATSIHEWWRRWNVHFRDFLVDVFFYPLMIKWRKRNPYLTIVVGCASVFLLGSTVFHWIGKYYFQVGSHTNIYWSISVENLLMFVAVAIGLCLEKRRILLIKERPPAKPPRLDDPGSPLGAWFGSRLTASGKLAATYAFLLVVVVFAGYGSTYAAYYRPVEQTHDAFSQALAAAQDGDRQRAARLVGPHVDTLERQVRALPREPVRRLRLAFAHSLQAPWADPNRAREHLEIGRRFADLTDVEQAALLAHLWPKAPLRADAGLR